MSQITKYDTTVSSISCLKTNKVINKDVTRYATQTCHVNLKFQVLNVIKK